MIYGEKINALDYVGYFGPIILIVVTVAFYMWHYSEQRHKIRAILAKFGGLLIFSSILNAVLKEMIGAPRPSGEIALFGTPRERDFYGMPSGHAQMVAFVTAFFIKNANEVNNVNPTWFAVMTVGFLAISILTVIQRYSFRAHTLAQLAVGLVVGGGVGWLI
uniref:Phosphatidic acid phosphatase type 2/haloperoxidase domain-containing protein n=1 Tax=viral metagenome TaxID=1070528 RepID=A0A6C0BTH6_9ZZZZ